MGSLERRMLQSLLLVLKLLRMRMMRKEMSLMQRTTLRRKKVWSQGQERSHGVKDQQAEGEEEELLNDEAQDQGEGEEVFQGEANGFEEALDKECKIHCQIIKFTYQRASHHYLLPFQKKKKK